MAKKFRKRPVVIEALQWTGRNFKDMQAFIGEFEDEGPYLMGPLVIETLEGDMKAQPGDWIIKGVAGECYPCKPDIFAATYEPVEEE